MASNKPNLTQVKGNDKTEIFIDNVYFTTSKKGVDVEIVIEATFGFIGVELASDPAYLSLIRKAFPKMFDARITDLKIDLINKTFLLAYEEKKSKAAKSIEFSVKTAVVQYN